MNAAGKTPGRIRFQLRPGVFPAACLIYYSPISLRTTLPMFQT